MAASDEKRGDERNKSTSHAGCLTIPEGVPCSGLRYAPASFGTMQAYRSLHSSRKLESTTQETAGCRSGGPRCIDASGCERSARLPLLSLLLCVPCVLRGGVFPLLRLSPWLPCLRGATPLLIASPASSAVSRRLQARSTTVQRELRPSPPTPRSPLLVALLAGSSIVVTTPFRGAGPTRARVSAPSCERPRKPPISVPR